MIDDRVYYEVTEIITSRFRVVARIKKTEIVKIKAIRQLAQISNCN